MLPPTIKALRRACVTGWPALRPIKLQLLPCRGQLTAWHFLLCPTAYSSAGHCSVSSTLHLRRLTPPAAHMPQTCFEQMLQVHAMGTYPWPSFTFNMAFCRMARADCCLELGKQPTVPGVMQLINMAGVVARPKRATLTPLLVSPAASAVASSGPVMRGSRPICRQGRPKLQWRVHTC